MNKAIAQLVAVLALIVILIPILSSQGSVYPLADAQLYVDPVSIDEPVDATFSITAGIADIVDLGGFGVILGWDPAVLEYVSHTATPGNVINSPVLPVADTVDAAAGTYELAAATLGGGGFTGSGTIFTLTLKVIAVGVSPLEWLLDDLATSAAQPIVHTTVNGTFDNRPPAVQYELVIGVSGSGTTDPVPGTYLYDAGTEVTVDAIPDGGWMLDHWLLDAMDVGSTDPYMVTMNADHTLTAVFVEIPAVEHTIESSDSAGTVKNIFDLTDDVYATGTGYSPSTTYDVYLVEDVTWVDGMAIPARVAGTTTSITSDASGNVPATLLWSNPLVPGKYDIVVDVDGDGLYYAESDALDDNDTEVTAGLFVVPEFWLGTILALAGCFAALGLFVVRKRKSVNNFGLPS